MRRILASPYTRALETAEIIASALNLELQVEPLVREHCRFHCDIGSPMSDLARRWPAIDFAPLPERWWPNLDESEEELAERGRKFRQFIAFDRHSAQTPGVTPCGFFPRLAR